MESQNKKSNTWLDIPLSRYIPEFNLELVLVIFILAAAVFSRFYHVDLRVMSHDEVNHVVPSWDLFQGRGYRHDPVTHGPLQFHLVALSYFILGDNDFSSRVPSVVFSIATIAFVMFGYRRYLGRKGALIGAFLFLISPYMLFYGRYTRNEAFVALFGVMTIYAILRHLERGDKFSLYLLVAATALNFTVKETAFIYTAQMLLFLAIVFLNDVLNLDWFYNSNKTKFILSALAALLMLGAALGYGAWNASSGGGDESTEAIAGGTEAITQILSLSQDMIIQIILVLFIVLFAILAVMFLVRDVGWQQIKEQKSFSLLIVIGTMVLPQLVAFPIKMIGWNPLDYGETGMIRTSIFLVVFAAIAISIGIWWNSKIWLNCAAIFYGIFTIFYTTFFTNGQGFFTGLVGSLGYWLSQQGVQRGSQPWYYYAAIQLPVYEFLAVLGSLLAVYFGLRHRLFASIPGISPALQGTGGSAMLSETEKKDKSNPSIEQGTPVPVLALLIFWSITSLIAYSIAGEKMPWITVHIALPLLLAAAWGLGYLADIIPWKKIIDNRSLVAVLLVPVFITSLAAVFGSFFSNNLPFQGNTTQHLQASTSFLLSVITAIFSGYGMMRLLRDWEPAQVIQLVTLVFFAVLACLTARAAYMASYINYDNAKEYLVYAHAAPGPKEVLYEVEEISRRTTGGLDIVAAYDNDGLYPYWWYFRDYPNHKWYTDKPTRDLLDAPVIIAGESNFGKLDSIVKDNYVQIDYIRLWWPNQDYFNLTWERIKGALMDAKLRAAIFNIWLNRDYDDYAEATNNANLTLEDWQPSSRMRFYIRKDVVAQMWKYGSTPAMPIIIETDPYEEKMISLDADRIIGTQGTAPGQLSAPRGVAVADDYIYVADSQNNRIQQFTQSGDYIRSWGSYADATAGDASGGTFSEPWGIAVGPDGNIYVSDTWNHRIQKFTADGKFITMWGHFGQAETNDAFWGPRGISVDSEGRVFVADTGNKRIVVFTSDGDFITQFGSAGVDDGQFDEPVGLSLDDNGNVYVADTWNQRIQVFSYNPSDEMPGFIHKLSWEVNGWYGQSLDNKPFISADGEGNVFVTDPEGYRVLQFSQEGEFIRGWGDDSPGVDGFGLPSGIAAGPDQTVWVSDAGNHRLLRFIMP